MQNSGIQYHIRTKKGDVGKYVILTGDPKRCSIIAENFDSAVKVADNREFVTYTGTLSGVKVSVCSTGIGGPSAAIALEELVKCGADTFIRVGTAGGMDTDVKSGDLVVATGAVRAEGTSCEYAPLSYPAVSDITLTSALIKACKDRKKPYHAGVVQSKDSFYGQHEPDIMPVSQKLNDNWQAYLKMGALASEMECAALFIVARFLRVRCSCVLEILANQEREKKGLENKIVLSTSAAVDVAVEAVKILIKDEQGK